jgi:hypothetical protein
MITNIPNLGMNYVNYATSIQQKHHVELLGWPESILFANPHHITVVAVARMLQHALTVATCKWVVMSTRRVKEHSAVLAALTIDGGDTVGKKRKQRSDKGKKRKRAANAAAEDEEDGEEDDDGDDDVPPPAKRRSHKKANIQAKAASAAKKAQHIANTLPPTAPKSKEFLDTEDDESDS